MSKCLKKYGAIAFFAALMIWLCFGSFCQTVFAEGYGAVKLSCRVEKNAVSGMTWNIYKVGEKGLVRDTLCYKAYVPFDNYYVSIRDTSADSLADMASTLENMAILDKIPPLDTQISDANGELTFSNLEPGLYLLSGKYFKAADGILSYKPTPALVEVTDTQDIIPVNAKIRALKTLNGEITSHTVKKIWENDTIEVRPQSVTAEIYQDGELVETVELSEANNWTYKWNTDVDADWRVREVDYFDKYTVIYRSNDANTEQNQYAIVNTFDETGENVVQKTTTAVTTAATTPTVTTTARSGAIGEGQETATTASSSAAVEDENLTTAYRSSAQFKVTTAQSVTTAASENKLPQTGQLWWPVPVLAFGGTVLIAVGFRMRKKRDTE